MRRLAYIYVILTAIMVFSCKPSVPGEYIQPGDMESILYDYHIAMAMTESNSDGISSSDAVNQRAYKLAVLKKHGVTEEQFDNSLKYYMRHTEHLYDMYENLSERLEGESSAMGVGGDAGYKGILTANGDSADIWIGDRVVMLLADAPYNKKTFSFKADTTFHKGDRLMLSFNTRYIIQDGVRDAVAVMCVRFANDSIASQYQRLSSSKRQTISIMDYKRVGVKEVSGYMLFTRGLDRPSSTLKLLSVTDIQLLKIHTKDNSETVGRNDPLGVQTPLGVSRNDVPDKRLPSSEGEFKTVDSSVATPVARPPLAPRSPDRNIRMRPDAPANRPGNDGEPPVPLRIK